MAYSIHLKDTDIEFPIEMGRTILETALARGIDYPHGCRSGNCGACKSVLHSGEVEMSPYSEFALTAEEKDRGLILACRSVPWSDCEISPIDEDEAEVHASRNLNCRVAELVQATHDIKIVRLEIEGGGTFDFSAGQYAELSFPGLPPRDFSMANQPGAAILEFHIRAMAGGAVSSHVADELKPGDPVNVKGPLGTAYYRPNHKGPIIAAAGGSGLAPIKSIIEKALAGGAEQDIHFYFGIRDERDLYLEDHFLDLCGTHPNLTFTPVLSEPTSASGRRTGFIADILAEDFADLDGYKSYLAGPPVMVETSVEKLTSLGMARLDCHADAFYTEAEKAALEEKS